VIEIASTLTRIASFVRRGALGPDVLDALVSDGEFIAKESDLWDFKEAFPEPDDAVGRAKFVLALVSFHNSFGGYLVVGVAERVDRLGFVPKVGRLPSHREVDELEALIESYTGGHRLSVTMSRVTSPVGETNVELALLHVPQRPHDTQPWLFAKNGPQAGKKVLFGAGSIYLRWGGTSTPAQSTEHMRFLLSRRSFEGMLGGAEHAELKIGDNTLPDRQQVCSHFVGRERFLERLWGWMPAQFDRIRVLAGEGGRGKTSIGFEFAADVCRVGPAGISRVLWFTGKTRQYVGAIDAYRDLGPAAFVDAASLLRALGREYALTTAEVAEDVPREPLVRRVVEAVKLYPALIIVDDVDSVGSVDEQRRVHETVMQLSNSTGSRFLVTTRMNLTYSPDTCLTIGGMELDEYHAFTVGLASRMQLERPFSWKELERLRTATDGSPLYTESLLRLLRQGESLGSAIQSWRGQDGENVRAAALRREIEHLTPEARRVLLAAAHLSEASLAELHEVTGLARGALSKCVGELQSLFLLSAPGLSAEEPRFRINDTTARFALEAADKLVPDPKAIQKTVRTFRSGGSTDGHSRSSVVARGVSQAMAQLRSGNFDGAVETAQATVKETDSGDAYLLLGRCQEARWLNVQGAPTESRDAVESRKAFRRAHELGTRKPELYELWFEAEYRAEHFGGAVDVATTCLGLPPTDPGDWYTRRGAARAALARTRALHGSAAQAQNDYSEAISDLESARKCTRDPNKQQLLESFYGTLREERKAQHVDDTDFREEARVELPRKRRR